MRVVRHPKLSIMALISLASMPNSSDDLRFTARSSRVRTPHPIARREGCRESRTLILN